MIYLSEKDNGIYDAMNKGVKIARFDYVVFINAGDIVDLKNLDFSLMQLLILFILMHTKPLGFIMQHLYSSRVRLF